MKTLATLLFTVLLSTSVAAQAPATPAPAAAQPQTPAKKPTNVKPAQRPPASTIPPPIARLSTAQRAALANTKPGLQQLPDFTVTDRDGHAVAAQTLTKSNHWLLLYRQQNCLPCDRLMNTLAASTSGSLKSGQPYVIVVAGKSPNGLEAVHAHFVNLNDATWLADTNDQFLTALKPTGSPVLYVMDGSQIVSKIPGNLSDPARVEKLATSWLSQPARPALPAHTTLASPATPLAK